MGKITKKCNICGSDAEYIFKSKVLNKYDINYFLCNFCSLLQTEEPFWLAETYSNPLSISYDTGYLIRNISLSQLSSKIIYYLFDKNGKYLDYGGGYGIFTRLMRDIGFDFYWDDAYSINIFSPGFEVEKFTDIAINGVTAFEVAEHLKNFNDLINYTFYKCDAQFLLFSTRLYGDTIPDKDWAYYSFEAGAHISLYNKNTLEWIAKKYNLYFYSNNSSFHIFSKCPINGLPLRFILSRFGKYLPIKLKSKYLKDSQLIKKQLESSVYGI